MKLKEDKFELNRINKFGSLMTVGNGYLGLRASHEEDYPDQIRGLYLNGVYDKGVSGSVAELVNLPDVLKTDIYLNDEFFNLQAGELEEYQRELDFEKGELVRTVLWKSTKKESFEIVTRRIVSQLTPGLIVHQIDVTPLTSETSIRFKVGIDGQQTNFGEQHLIEQSQRIINHRFLSSTYRTVAGEQDIIVSMELNHDAVFSTKNRQLSGEIVRKVVKGETLTLEKTIRVSLLEEFVENEEMPSYQTVKASSSNVWQKYWQKNRIVITSENKYDQLAIDFALYHLFIMEPKSSDMVSIGAKGLSGPGYKGHVFWDTEIFLLPFYVHSDPEIAKNLLLYRYQRLAEAKEKAIEEGNKGALFPWESARSGHEETPEYAAINIRTGERQKVASAIAEHHIVADVAYAVCKYVEATKDQQFMADYGAELLLETAKYWLSRGLETNGRIDIKNVIGPDEYTEFIDNNAYTNYMAMMNVKKAIEFNQTNEAFIEEAEVFLEKLYLPKANSDKIIPQDDSFLGKPQIDLAPYKKQQGKQGILLDYSRAEVNELQVLKQADVVMLQYLLPELFSVDIKQSNLFFYEERTIHDSSLSKAIHAIEALRTGLADWGYELFSEATMIDLGPAADSSDEGIHAASLGAIWLTVVFGFAGFQVTPDNISLNPVLPKEWQELTFAFDVYQERIYCQMSHDRIQLTKESMTTIQVESYGQTYQLVNKLEIARK